MWLQAFAETGIVPEFYSERVRGADEYLPWDIIDCGVTKEFLKREWLKAKKEEVAKLLQYEMENAVSLRVPLTVEVGVGKTWYDTKE